MYKYLILFILFFAVPLCAQEKEKGKLAIFEDEASGESEDSDENEEVVDLLIFAAEDCGSCREGIFHSFMNVIRIMVYAEEFDKYFIHNQYTPYPYYYRDSGIYGRDTEKNFAIALSSSYFHHSDHLNGFRIAADISPYPLFSVGLEYTDLTETLHTRYDHLRLYNIFVNYNRVRSEHVVFSWGVGLKGMRGDSDMNAFALSTDLEIFPVAPVSFSMHYNIGFFQSAPVDEFSFNLNLHQDRYRFQIGFQNFRAGRMNIGGLTLGLGVYL